MTLLQQVFAQEHTLSQPWQYRLSATHLVANARALNSSLRRDVRDEVVAIDAGVQGVELRS